MCFDRMARAKMGIVTAYLDQAKDTYANLRKASNDKFGITFKATLKQYVNVYVTTKAVADALVTVGEKALNQLASKIPVPGLGAAISKVISFAADKAREELHKASINETLDTLATKSGRPRRIVHVRYPGCSLHLKVHRSVHADWQVRSDAARKHFHF